MLRPFGQAEIVEMSQTVSAVTLTVIRNYPLQNGYLLGLPGASATIMNNAAVCLCSVVISIFIRMDANYFRRTLKLSEKYSYR